MRHTFVLSRAAVTRAFLCVSIDCECDKGPAWRSQRPLAFEGIRVGIAARLQPMFVRRRAKGTYLLSPEVMRDGRSVETLRALEGDHELGTHLHGEYAEPGAFEPEATAVFQRDYAPDVERAKLVYLTDLFARAFDRKPASFRAGRFGIGAESIGILEDLGYTVESSVTPFVDWSDKAPGLSFVGAPSQPYHPDARSPGRRGTSRILEVPVTIRPRAMQRVPIVGKLVEARWLRPTHGTAASLVAVARDEIADARARRPRAPVVLNAMFHNVEIIAGASPYAANDADARAILARLDALLAFAEKESIAVVGLGDLPAIFDEAARATA
jgi:hypothetical protein